MNQSSIFPSRAHRDKLVAKLKELGIETIVVSFSGSGDSGSITGIDAKPTPNDKITTWEHADTLRNHTMLWVMSWSVFENGSWVRRKEDKEMCLDQVLEKVAYQALDESGLDWYNNDGGQGEFTMTIEGNSVEIELDVGINYTQTHEHRFRLGNDWTTVERLPLP